MSYAPVKTIPAATNGRPATLEWVERSAGLLLLASSREIWMKVARALCTLARLAFNVKLSFYLLSLRTLPNYE